MEKKPGGPAGPGPRGGREVQPGVEKRQGGPAGPGPKAVKPAPAEKKKPVPEGEKKKNKQE